MNFIKLFIASSVVEFEHERQELSAYINSLNKIYVRRGIFFDLVICEDLSNAVARERKQAEYNEQIASSQYFYVIFGAKAGDYTIEEFDVALHAFHATGLPKIYTYFMQLPKEQVDVSVINFMERVDRELGHFYSTFTHVDSIKLSMIMELSRNPAVGGQLKLEDGNAVLDGNPVLSMERIPLYSKNQAVQQLLAQKRELDEEFATLSALPDSEPVKRLRLTNSEKRNKITEQLHELESDVLGLYQSVSEKRQLGARLNWREKKAMELVDAGNYEGAKNILRDSTWKEEIRHAEAILDQAKGRIQEYISGQKTLISAIRSTGITSDSEKEIIAIYEDISALAKKYQLDLDVLYDYASFLENQCKYLTAIRVAEQLEACWNASDVIPDFEQVPLLNLLGRLYATQLELQKALACYQNAMRFCEIRPHSQLYDSYVAVLSDSLGSLYGAMGQYDHAEKSFNQALGIYQRLAKNGATEPLSNLVSVLSNLAQLRSTLEDHREAARLHKEALQIQHKLEKKHPGEFEGHIAMSCRRLATELMCLGQFDRAAQQYQEALVIERKLAKQNPAAYEPEVAALYYDIGSLLHTQGNHADAQGAFQSALSIYLRLTSENPAAYSQELAKVYNGLATLLDQTNRPKEAQPLYRQAVKLLQELESKNPGVFKGDLAQTQDNLAFSLFSTGNDEEAKNTFFISWQLFHELMAQSPAVYQPKYAVSCYRFAVLMDNCQQYQMADLLYQDALKYLREPAAQNPTLYEPILATACHEYGILTFNQLKDKPTAKTLFQTALAIYNRYPSLASSAREVRVIL